MKNDIKKILFTEQQLMDKVAELGARITEDYEGKNPLIVPTGVDGDHCQIA